MSALCEATGARLAVEDHGVGMTEVTRQAIATHPAAHGTVFTICCVPA